MEILFSEQSPYQHIMICRRGNVNELVLDGNPQTCLPNNSYYETLIGPGDCESYLILGGGDLTCVDVFVNLGIENWRMVEIDQMVIDACAPYCRHRRNTWGKRVIIGDALEYLLNSEPVDHIIVDLIAMAKFDVLAQSMSIQEFLKLLVEKSKRYVSGFIDSTSTGTAAGIILKNEFMRLGMREYELLLNPWEENFFWTSHDRLDLPAWLRQYAISYGASLRDEKVFELHTDEQLLVINEGL